MSAFNIYLCALGLLALSSGCETEGKMESDEKDPKKQLTVLRCHMETVPDRAKSTIEVPVFRARPFLVTIEKDSFVNEQEIASAELVDEMGGFSIQIEFTRKGRWILEKFTAGNQGRRIAIFSAFAHEQRWIAAPLITEVISNGKLTFTPDATREESIRIIRGIKNVARKMEHDPRF